ncbi:unnamed protein product [Trichogramma brassicae]|uniref:Uncharacterized protein n=1 Tax=Trichogramma brassicae TaxID=86971 RepID=A0A6H5I5K6_9HYME|nr:unnamed protein product [Trichogramma brassicae]
MCYEARDYYPRPTNMSLIDNESQVYKNDKIKFTTHTDSRCSGVTSCAVESVWCRHEETHSATTYDLCHCVLKMLQCGCTRPYMRCATRDVCKAKITPRAFSPSLREVKQIAKLLGVYRNIRIHYALERRLYNVLQASSSATHPVPPPPTPTATQLVATRPRVVVPTRKVASVEPRSQIPPGQRSYTPPLPETIEEDRRRRDLREKLHRTVSSARPSHSTSSWQRQAPRAPTEPAAAAQERARRREQATDPREGEARGRPERVRREAAVVVDSNVNKKQPSNQTAAGGSIDKEKRQKADEGDRLTEVEPGPRPGRRAKHKPLRLIKLYMYVFFVCLNKH